MSSTAIVQVSAVSSTAIVQVSAVSSTAIVQVNVVLWIFPLHEVRGLWGMTFIELLSWDTGSKCVKHCFGHCDQPWYSCTCLHCCIAIVARDGLYARVPVCNDVILSCDACSEGKAG